MGRKESIQVEQGTYYRGYPVLNPQNGEKRTATAEEFYANNPDMDEFEGATGLALSVIDIELGRTHYAFAKVADKQPNPDNDKWKEKYVFMVLSGPEKLILVPSEKVIEKSKRI